MIIRNLLKALYSDILWIVAEHLVVLAGYIGIKSQDLAINARIERDEMKRRG